ncbi:unnamed protein product [Pylaiella littoralis]
MGNTLASQKDGRSADAPRAAKDLNDLLPALRERFEELAGLPAEAAAAAAAVPIPVESSTAPEVSAQRLQDPTTAPGAGGGEQENRYVLFDDWSELPGPRGAHVARRLYAVLDANGDGRLDFEEFASAACLLKGSPDESKLALLFKMYGDASKGGFVGREGLKAFILDVIAASPPLLAPPDLVVVADGDEGGGGSDGVSETPRPSASKTVLPHEKRTEGRAGVVAAADAACAAVLPQPDLEKELGGVLAGMARVVLAEYDADNDGWLKEKEWRAYLKQEEGSVGVFLKTLSDSVGKLLLP